MTSSIRTQGRRDALIVRDREIVLLAPERPGASFTVMGDLRPRDSA